MHSTTIINLAMAGLSLAQTSTISLFIPGADTQPLVASIVGSDSKATTYAFQCAPGTDGNDCGFEGVVTLTEGPATAAYTFAPDVEDGTTLFTGYYDCSLAASSAVCTASAGGAEANDPGITTTTLTGTDYSSMPVVITAGAAVASNTGSSSVPASTTSSTGKATGSSTSGSNTKTSGSQTSSGAGVQTSGSSSKASGTSTSTSTSTGGGPAITGNPAWMLGGAALALAALA